MIFAPNNSHSPFEHTSRPFAQRGGLWRRNCISLDYILSDKESGLHRVHLNLFLYLCFIWSGLAATSASAKSYDPGDVITLKCGSEPAFQLKLGRHVGSGTTTQVFQLASDAKKIIRLPRPSRRVAFGSTLIPTNKFINYFVKGQSVLLQNGVPVVRIFESCKDKFVIAEYVESRMSLREFFINYAAISIEQRERILYSLFEFAKTTYMFDDIGDFKSDSLFFEESRGWIIVDVTHKHRRTRNLRTSKQTTFDHMIEEPEIDSMLDDGTIDLQVFDTLSRQLSETVIAAREHFCERTLESNK